MAKKTRVSTQDIAEILVKRFKDMDNVAESMKDSAIRIEKVHNEPIDINLDELKEVYNLIKTENKNFLNAIENLNNKNKNRLPNYILVMILTMFLISIGTMFYTSIVIKENLNLKNKIELSSSKI